LNEIAQKKQKYNQGYDKMKNTLEI